MKRQRSCVLLEFNRSCLIQAQTNPGCANASHADDIPSPATHECAALEVAAAIAQAGMSTLMKQRK